MNKPIIDPATQKAINELNDWKQKMWAQQSLRVYIDKPHMMFCINNQPNPTIWQRLKNWITRKRKRIIKPNKL